MFNKFFLLTFSLFLIILINPVMAQNQNNTSTGKDSISITDEYIMDQVKKGRQYILLLLKRGPNTDQNEEEAQKIQMAHLHHLFTLKAEGKLVLAGPLDTDVELRGIGIFNLTDMEQVKKLVEEDPAVKSGRMTYELYPWFGLPGDGLPNN